MAVLLIEGMEFYAYHGCFREEQLVGCKYLVDIKFETDSTKAEKTDNIDDALNYQHVYEIIKSEFEIKSNILEHLGRRIIDRIKSSFKDIKDVELKISKLNPPISGKTKKFTVIIN